MKEEQSAFQRGDLKTSYELALAGYQHTSVNDPIHSAFGVELGRIQWFRNERRKALGMLSQPLAPGSDPLVAVQRSELLAAFLAKSGQIDKARLVLAEAGRRFEQGTPNPFLEAARAEVELQNGNYVLAIDRYRSALQGASLLKNEYLQMRVLLGLGAVETRLQHFDEALDRLREAVPLAQHLQNRFALEILAGDLGFAQTQLGDFAGAEENFRLAKSEAQDLGSKEDAVLWARDEGNVKALRGDIKGAQFSYEQSLREAIRISDDAQIAGAHVDLGTLLLSTDRLDEAMPHLAAAANLYAQRGNKEELLSVTLLEATYEVRRGNADTAKSQLLKVDQNPAAPPSLRWQAEQELALIAIRQGDDRLSHVWFERAVRTFQRQQCSVHDITSKLPFQENGTDLYRSYIEHLIQEGRTDEALMMYDQGRATSLRDCETGAGEASAKRRPVAAPDARTLAKSLHGTLLIYYLLPQTSYLWVVSADHTGFYRLPPEEEITRLVSLHEALITDSQKDPLQVGDEAGRRLYDSLVGPARKQIRAGAAVYVLADRGLSRLNFDTLLTPGDHPHFWIEDVTIINASSLRLLAQGMTQARPRSNGRLLLVGDPEYPPNVPELPHAADEVEKVRDHFRKDHRTVLTGASATSSSYEKQDPGQYSNIHFVAHAEASVTSPMDSFVLLSGGSDKLYARDIAKRPLHADLVTLSTCYSSGTSVYSGEGLVGLAWAFERAGARNVIGALWEVSDDSAPRLMDHMYANLAMGMPADQALRDAKLTALHSADAFRKPFYWAQFQLYSNSGEQRVH